MTDSGKSLGVLLRDRTQRSGERELFRFPGRSYSYGEIEERTNRLANVLRTHGVRRGDRVALMMPNVVDFPVSWLALAKVGAVTVAVNTQCRDADLAHVLSDSGAALVLAQPEHVPALRAVAPRCPSLREIAVLRDQETAGAASLAAELAAAPSTFALEDLGPGDLASIQYTSGTTGFPKGCMLPHRFLIRMARVVEEAYGIAGGDVMLTAQPFYYLDPQWASTLAIRTGAPLVILPGFSASTFWRSVEENGVTFFYVLGTMPVYLFKQPEEPACEKRHRVRLALCSGIPRELHAAFEARWGCPWREGYGSTESGVDLLVGVEEADSVGSGRMGRTVRDREARVVDESGRDVPEGEVGELLLRGEGMMLGYWGQPEATAEKLRDGWLRSGDLVRREPSGHFTIVGRTKDMIRRTGENISAVEVESVLGQHPAVRAAAVVPVPDELRGEEVKAFVQLQPGQTKETAPPEELLAFVRARLAAFKVPRFVEYVDAFPLTPSERVAKQELVERKKDQRAGAWDAATQRWG